MILLPLSLAAIPDQDGEQSQQQPVKEESTVTGQPVNESGTPQGNMPEIPNSDSFSFIQSLMALSFVLGLIFLAAYFFKKVTGIRSTGLRKSQVPINVVGNMPLGDKKFLSVVEISGKHYFIGITQNSINLLSELQLDFPASEGEAEEEAFESIFHKAKVLLNKARK
jgi:flagellar biosynthetic protein FliO